MGEEWSMGKITSPIESLAKQLVSLCPEAAVSIDKPKRKSGVWFLDASLNGHRVSVQWQSKHGFGVSSSSSGGYGEGADEVYREVDAVLHRVLSLLLSRGETSPPPAVRRAELRREVGLSQIDMAQRLHVQQGAVSRMERRGDVKISSLREYCQSLGGSLMLMARFPNGSAKIIQLEDE
jgi:DNA-binding XRE family transcriptional regulator